jgi:hypothetical protein
LYRYKSLLEDIAAAAALGRDGGGGGGSHVEELRAETEAGSALPSAVRERVRERARVGAVLSGVRRAAARPLQFLFGRRRKAGEEGEAEVEIEVGLCTLYQVDP